MRQFLDQGRDQKAAGKHGGGERGEERRQRDAVFDQERGHVAGYDAEHEANDAHDGAELLQGHVPDQLAVPAVRRECGVWRRMAHAQEACHAECHGRRAQDEKAIHAEAPQQPGRRRRPEGVGQGNHAGVHAEESDEVAR